MRAAVSLGLNLDEKTKSLRTGLLSLCRLRRRYSYGGTCHSAALNTFTMFARESGLHMQDGTRAVHSTLLQQLRAERWTRVLGSKPGTKGNLGPIQLVPKVAKPFQVVRRTFRNGRPIIPVLG